MQNRVVAGRYAAALLRTAVAHGELDRIEQDLDLLVRSVTAEETLSRFLDNPRETPATKKQLVDKVFGDKLSPAALNFFHLLIEKKRHAYLATIAELFKEHANAVRGVAVAKARVAKPLTPEAEAAIKTSVKELTGRDVRLEVEIDPSVVGGVHLRVGNRLIDYTLQRQLERLRENIASGRGLRGTVGGPGRARVRWKHQE